MNQTKKNVTIRDNSDVDKETLDQIPNIRDCLAGKTIDELEKEGIFVFANTVKNAEDIESTDVIIKRNGENYHTGNIMGFFGIDDEMLEIQSRFSGYDNDYFLQYMLARVLGFPNIHKYDTSSKNKTKLFDYFVFLFPYYLKKAQKKGMFKTYVRKEYNDLKLKGPVDIARHIKCNTPFLGKVSYSQREYSYDNYLTELIRHTIEFIKTKPYGKAILSSVRDESDLICQHTSLYRLSDRKSIIDKNKKTPVKNSYFNEYRQLQRLCIFILQHQKNQFSIDSKKIHGILFDGSWVWEEYIGKILRDDFYHPRNKENEGSQQLFSKEGMEKNGQVGEIYPDFIGKSQENRIIADAKYKTVKNIGGHDYAQILSYMLRFDSKCGFFLYPENEEKKFQKLFLNSGTSYEDNVRKRTDITVIKLGLKIDDNVENYEQFSLKMKENEEQFLAQLKSLSD